MHCIIHRQNPISQSFAQVSCRPFDPRDLQKENECQPAITCLKLTIKALDQTVKYIQS